MRRAGWGFGSQSQRVMAAAMHEVLGDPPTRGESFSRAHPIGGKLAGRKAGTALLDFGRRNTAGRAIHLTYRLHMYYALSVNTRQARTTLCGGYNGKDCSSVPHQPPQYYGRSFLWECPNLAGASPGSSSPALGISNGVILFLD